MLTFKNWELMPLGTAIIVQGNIYGHYRLKDGLEAHSSMIEKFYRVEEGIVVETFSESIYLLRKEEVNNENWAITRAILDEQVFVEDDTIKKRMEKKAQEYNQMRKEYL